MTGAVAQRRRSTAAFAVAATLAWGVLYYAFAVVLTPIGAEQGWSNATIAGAFSTGMLASGFAAPLVGRTVDRHGARLVVAYGTALGAAGLLVWSKVTTIAGLYATWAVIGAAMAATLYEPAAATVGRYPPQQRRTALLAITLVTGLSSTIFSPLTAALVDLAGWRGGLRVLAAGFVVIGVPVALAGIPRHGEDRSATPPPPVTEHTSPTRSPDFRRMAAAFAIARGLGVAVAAHVVAYLITLGFTPLGAAALAGAIGVAKVVGRIAVTVAQRLTDGFRAAIVTLGVQGASLTLPVLFPGGVGVIAMVALFGASYGATMILRPELIATRFAGHGIGRFNGAAAFVGAIAGAAAPLFVGVGVTTTGAYTVPWLVLAAAGIAAAVLIAPLRPR